MEQHPTQGLKRLVIVDISKEPAKKIQRLLPLAEYIAGRLEGYGQGDVKIAGTSSQVVKWMEDGQVDIYMDSPFPAMLVSRASKAQPLCIRWKTESNSTTR